jgi:hypothetical protein
MKAFRVLAVMCGILLLYVGSFLAFRACPVVFSLAPPSDPQHYLVVFSHNTNLHCVARAIFSPLIAAIPGHRRYPSRLQHELLVGGSSHWDYETFQLEE